MDKDLPYIGDGKLINSPLLNGLNKDTAIDEIIKYFNKTGIGQKKNKF